MMIQAMFFFWGDNFRFSSKKIPWKLWNFFLKKSNSTNFAILGENFAQISTSQV
jgi:hypothetical protein